MPKTTPQRARKPRESTAKRHDEILRAATVTFGSRGYQNGSLGEIAEQVGMTHAGVLHHFGSKEQLLLAVLSYRDTTDVEHLEGKKIPTDRGLFRHLITTAGINASRPGIVQAYAVLSAEAVTDDHPGKDYFRLRYRTLRAEVGDALRELAGPDAALSDQLVADTAAAVLAVMDGLQVQWLLAPDEVDLARATDTAINGLLNAAVAGIPNVL